MKPSHPANCIREEIYRDLSTWLVRTEELRMRIEDVDRRVCLAILEEDLRALVEEWEEYLLEHHDSTSESCSFLESLKVRSSTVLEEIRALEGIIERP